MTGAFLTALFFAGNAVCARRAALHYGGTEGNFLRLLFAFAVLGAWAHAAGQGVGGGAFAWFFVSGAVGFGLGGLTMFHALPLIGSNLSMLIVQCGSAVAGALIEWLWLGAQLSATQAGLAILTLTGVAIGLMGSIGPIRAQPVPRDFARGILLAVISACAQGGGAVISRKAFAVLRTNGFFMDGATSAYQRALGGLAVGALALVAVRRWPALQRKPPLATERVPAMAVPPWAWTIFNALLGPVLGVTCYQWALRTNPAGLVLPIVATAPLLTVPVARALERSRPGPRYWLGAVLAVLGAAGLAVAK
ncbi:MAG TPA: DMT family transporter [Opitutaceae bacterium]|nr:DMT family transporter [Opitutaceae bacterium]